MSENYPANLFFTSDAVNLAVPDSIKENTARKHSPYNGLFAEASTLKDIVAVKTIQGSVEYIYPEKPTTGQIFPRGFA